MHDTFLLKGHIQGHDTLLSRWIHALYECTSERKLVRFTIIHNCWQTAQYPTQVRFNGVLPSGIMYKVAL